MSHQEAVVCELQENLSFARAATIAEYNESKEFHAFSSSRYDEGIIKFIRSVWEEHPEWDLIFLNEDVVLGLISQFEAEKEAKEQKEGNAKQVVPLTLPEGATKTVVVTEVGQVVNLDSDTPSEGVSAAERVEEVREQEGRK